MKSLANTEKFPAGVGVAVNREMMVWKKDNCYRCSSFILVWTGNYFIGKTQFGDLAFYEHACDVETDENSFRAPYIFTKECEMIKPSCLGEKRLDWCGCSWKRSGTHTRPMTAKEIYELAHQGAAFSRFIDGEYHNPCETSSAIIDKHGDIRYCLPCDMIDDEPKNWKWRKL